jgi:hypothetical protein
MIHRHSRLCWLAGGVAVAAAAATLITQTAGVAAVRGPAAVTAVARLAAGAAAPAGPSGREREVLLITGDRVLARPAAGGPVSGGMIRGNAGGLGGSMLSLGLGGQAYEIPVTALPFLGRGLDAGLFRLGSLLSRETAGLLPVRIGYRGAVPALPGVTITSNGRGSALGYLTAASARAFGAALERQYLADHARGSYGTDGMFGGGVSIALAGAPAPLRPPVTPDFPMATLTVTGTNSAGNPDTGDEIIVINDDNGDRFNDPNASASVFFNGTAKFSVPTGHYWAVGGFVDVAKDRRTATWRLDVLTQFTVAGATTVRTSARAATSKVTMVTPRPAQVIETDFNLLRGGRSGAPNTVGLTSLSGPVYVSLVSTRPTVGSLHAYAAQVLFSPPGRGVPYQYALQYVDPPGIISPQRYVVRPKDVATLSELFYQTERSGGDFNFSGFLPDASVPGIFDSVGPEDASFTIPGRDVLYVGGNVPAMIWQRSYTAFRETAKQICEGGQSQGFATLPLGAHLTERWGQFPLHPNANVNLAPADLSAGDSTQPSASRSGNTLRIDTTPFTDSQPGDTGAPGFGAFSPCDTSAGSYQIYQDGRKIAGGNAVNMLNGSPLGYFSTHVVLSPKPSVIRVALSAAIAGPDFTLSTASRTVWTWRSAFQPATRLPRGFFCFRDPVTLAPAPDRNCAVQPMMTLEYGVHGMALDGSVPAGRQVVGITVGHLQLAHAARITGARVSVSFDNGRTWHAATVTRVGGGRFAAVFTAPAGAYVMLRTSAADAVGGRITETITRAYKIGS